MIRKGLIISTIFLLLLVSLIYMGSLFGDYYSYAEEIVSKLLGNMCGTRGTSCADQLAKAVQS